VKIKINIICSIVISIIALFGVGMLTPIQFVDTTSSKCSSKCQGYVQGCEDGEADHDSQADAKYHYDANTVNQEYINGYQSGYYFGYFGPYDKCEAKDDRSIGCIFTHWDPVAQRPC
jgi:hypothetical protein